MSKNLVEFEFVEQRRRQIEQQKRVREMQSRFEKAMGWEQQARALTKTKKQSKRRR